MPWPKILAMLDPERPPIEAVIKELDTALRHPNTCGEALQYDPESIQSISIGYEARIPSFIIVYVKTFHASASIDRLYTYAGFKGWAVTTEIYTPPTLDVEENLRVQQESMLYQLTPEGIAASLQNSKALLLPDFYRKPISFTKVTADLRAHLASDYWRLNTWNEKREILFQIEELLSFRKYSFASIDETDSAKIVASQAAERSWEKLQARFVKDGEITLKRDAYRKNDSPTLYVSLSFANLQLFQKFIAHPDVALALLPD